MARINLKPILDRFVATIAARNTYGGGRMPQAVMKMVQVEIRNDGGGVTAPYWFAVFERGRGKRKSTEDSGLVYRIAAWMAKRNMFKSRTREGQMAEAKRVTWYMNKHGNKQFRRGVFVDIYTTARQQAVAEIEKEYSLAIGKITQDII